MENQAAGNGSMDKDRISQLPKPVLHHILTFLPQNDAVKTCVLSKSWRYLGCTRPNLKFNECSFRRSKETFVAVLDKTLQRYHDHNLSVQDFFLVIYRLDSNMVLLLKKWIPRVMLNMGVKRFKFIFYSHEYFDFPTSVVLKSESLQELYLGRCKLSQISYTHDEVHFKHLKRLSLYQVYIGDETFEKIMSSCLLIEYLYLSGCEGLRVIKVNKTHNNLKCFRYESYLIENGPSIQIDSPSVETISISNYPEWFHLNSYFKNLRSLYLSKVKMSSESLNNFWGNFPCLEKLTLHLCYGFKKFWLTSSSIKYLIIEVKGFLEATIDARNIHYFEYASSYVPSISFTETLGEWKFDILVKSSMNTSSSRFLKLNEMLKALSHCKISLYIDDPRLVVPDNYGGFYECVVIEKFTMMAYPASPLLDFLDYLFHIFHPKNIEQLFHIDPDGGWEIEANQVTESMCKILVTERETRHYFSQQNLEEVSMEASDEFEEEWHVVQGINFSECAVANTGTLNIRFKLKWGVN